MTDELRSRSMMASQLSTEGRFIEAIEVLKDLVERAAALKPHPGDLELFYNQLASLYLKTAEHKLAEVAARESLKIHSEFGDCGRETTRLADYQAMLARTLEAQRRYAEAAEALSRALPIFKAHLGEEDSMTRGIIAHHKYLTENAWRG